ncbi:hypothetical protein GJ496_003661 [Pomphorhynchus laevis]|nr:hypothetical protein GJ496_003661 [Pomphorhynchus laevis]
MLVSSPNEEETQRVIWALRSRRAPGYDDIDEEMLRAPILPMEVYARITYGNGYVGDRRLHYWTFVMPIYKFMSNDPLSISMCPVRWIRLLFHSTWVWTIGSAKDNDSRGSKNSRIGSKSPGLIAVGAALEINGGIVEDNAWLRKLNDNNHINFAELESVLRRINIALSWKLVNVELMTDSATAYHWIKSVATKDKPV